MGTKTPLAIVKEKFGDKAKLVAAVEQFTGEDLWVGRTNASKGLAHVSNAKLLRLHETFTQVKEKFGTRAKLIDAILELEKRSKDTGLKQKLSAWPVPRLFDAYKSASKRAAPTKPAPQRAAAQPKVAAAPKAATKTAKTTKATPGPGKPGKPGKPAK